MICASGAIRATVLAVDRFGNLELNVRGEQIAALGVGPGDRVELKLALDPYYAVVAETYSDATPGDLLVYEDSYGAWSIAIFGGNAAALTGATPGESVRISRAFA
jgi:S-adenosylmethionine hydrolase